MARCALFTTDLFGASGTSIWDHSGFNVSLPVSNVSTPLPGQVFEQLEAQFFGGDAGMFEVGTKTGVGVYINEGGGVLAGTVTSGVYTANALAVAVSDALTTLGAFTYVCTYHVATRKFQITVTGGTSILVNTNPNNVLTSECGFDSVDTSSLSFHEAEASRSSTMTRVIFDAEAGNTLAPDFVWTMLNSTGGTDTAASALYNNVTVYANATYLGSRWQLWDDSASETVDLSDRPAETENTIQGGATTGTGYRYWAFFWHHADDHTSHQVGLLRGAAALTSSTRQVREVGDQRIFNRTRPRTLENQHPVALLSEWRMSVEFERWEAADYRALKVEADRYGAADGVVFALRWSDIVAATLTVNAEADIGFVFYGSIIDSSSDSYAGKESDYLTGSLSFGQLRGP